MLEIVRDYQGKPRLIPKKIFGGKYDIVNRYGRRMLDTNDADYYIDAALNPKNKLYKSIQKLRQRGRDE